MPLYRMDIFVIGLVELRMETGNVSKKQQPDPRVINSPSPQMGLQHSENIPHTEAGFSWPLNKKYQGYQDYNF